ncbi:branched-chain amino acid ABC transporter permease [Streptomyces sp. NPDC001276]|uniref:branched-chain amino acid ABC transporter permease n=1 Tax=Streptomyces sp. NPDC001276 TaxID=3364555 RepID=UPI0036983E34
MDRLVTSLVGGLSLGGTLSLVALGLVLAFRSTHTFNFAHGEFMLIPAFLVARWQTDQASPLWVAVLAGLLVVAVIGVVFFRLVLKRLVGAPVFISVIATLGLSSILQGLVAIFFGFNQYSIRVPLLPDGVIELAGARISRASIVLLVFSLLLAFAVAAGLKFTHVGTMIRAAGQNPLLASQGGIRVTRLYTVSWAIAAVLAGVAGITYGIQNVVSPSLSNVALIAFPAMLLGGLDSIAGAIVGGIGVGVLQGFVTTYAGGQLTDVITYLALLVVLLFLPHGILGMRQVTRL